MTCWVQKLFSSLDCSRLCCDVRELQLSISMRKFSLLSQGLSSVSYLTVHATDICSLLSVTNCVSERDFPLLSSTANWISWPFCVERTKTRAGLTSAFCYTTLSIVDYDDDDNDEADWERVFLSVGWSFRFSRDPFKWFFDLTIG